MVVRAAAARRRRSPCSSIPRRRSTSISSSPWCRTRQRPLQAVGRLPAQLHPAPHATGTGSCRRSRTSCSRFSSRCRRAPAQPAAAPRAERIGGPWSRRLASDRRKVWYADVDHDDPGRPCWRSPRLVATAPAGARRHAHGAQHRRRRRRLAARRGRRAASNGDTILFGSDVRGDITLERAARHRRRCNLKGPGADIGHGRAAPATRPCGSTAT